MIDDQNLPVFFYESPSIAKSGVFPPWYQRDFDNSSQYLPHPWRGNLETVYREVDDIYETLFPRLSRALNQIWMTDYDERQIRIIVGPFFHALVTLVYEKYCFILSLEGSLQPNFGFECCTASNSKDFFAQCQTDEFNDFLTSYIITRMGVELLDSTEYFSFQALILNRRSLNFKNKLFRALLKPLQLLKQSDEIFIITPYLNYLDWARLEISLGQIPTFRFCWGADSASAPDRSKRNLLLNLLSPELGFRELDRIILELVAHLIPVSLFEDFNENLLSAQNLLNRKRPKLIIDANSFNSCDSFKIYTAAATALGTKLMLLQHGGYYGIGKFLASQDHELKISDLFFSSGWKASAHKNIFSGCFVKRIGYKKYISLFVKKRFKILVVDTVNPRVAHHLFGAPVGASHVLSSLGFRQQFLEIAVKEWPDQIAYKVPPHTYGYSETVFESPSGVTNLLSGSLYSAVLQSEIVVLFCNSTTLIEVLSLKIPFIVCFDCDHDWLLSHRGRRVISVCEAVGIYTRSVGSLLDQLITAAPDVENWWAEPGRQKAVKLLDQFLCNSDLDVVDTINNAVDAVLGHRNDSI